jgi:ABC-type uncharacterized transport system auxiliary subunit
MLRNILISLVIIFISACSIPKTKIYSLYLPAKESTVIINSDISVSIRMDSPKYLEQSYIAYRISPYQLEISRYAKWESSPYKIVKEAIKDSLISTGLFKEVRALNFAPEGFYLLDVNLKRFERIDIGNESFGELTINVVFYSADGKELYRNSISKSVKLEDKHFLNLAKALSNELSETIEEIKNNIIKFL